MIHCLSVSPLSQRLSVDLAQIAELIDLVSRSRIAELDVSRDGTRVRIWRYASAGDTAAVSHSAERARESAPVTTAAEVSSEPAPQTARAATETIVQAPMHGIFHRASAPGAAPFAEVGSPVEAGQKICIIEAMKTFIGVEAEASGTVLAVLADNGAEVEAGQPLFRIGPQPADVDRV
ncbi:acetyl-CoA carboxylase biotin carboxyl carrier protein [Chelatococcus asaccharovorans]|nr:acetyl-CoA carboxylase biotin carboxyl carrier protein [Chelatococcus asaccharovorans]